MKATLINTNLNPQSATGNAVTRLINTDLRDVFEQTVCLNLHEHALPLCDGCTCYQREDVQHATELVASSDCLIFCSPIYNYGINAATKNFLELTNDAWHEKTVGFVSVAGGSKSFLAVLPFANSLMTDHRCVIVPRYVYVTRSDFVDNCIPEDSDTRIRLKRLAHEARQLTHGQLIAGSKS